MCTYKSRDHKWNALYMHICTQKNFVQKEKYQNPGILFTTRRE